VDTFVLDDGWQAISGDWYPDSPEHPEPRWDGVPGSTFAPRFPDSTFAAVREAIAPMRLGLWMSPLHFNPASETYKAHPEWACAPAGHALAAYNTADPDSGSNEAGIGQWSAAALPHVEARMREAITSWGVEYFKLDFIAWLDCAGQGDLYQLREAFTAMLDRLRADHPHVTIQIDETNDYRLFPFESVSRGPSWFQNGSPGPDRLLHNLWNLSPYVPTHSLGQHVLGGRAYEQHRVDTLMAAAMPSHITFFSDLRGLPDEVVAEAAPWLAFYRAHRELLGGMAHPLLEDPLAGGWTALQPWDARRGQVLLVVPTREPRLAASTVVPEAADREWLAGDLHVHTCYSHDAYCGPDDDNTGPEELYTLSGDVEERFLEASVRGLDYLAITDHNDTRSATHPGFGSHGVVGVPGYEGSFDGHAQVLGSTEVLDDGAGDAAAINQLADLLRARGGVLQANHAAEGLVEPFECDRTDLLDWGYGYDVQPDTIEVWNIQHYFQPPMPSAAANTAAIQYWECWLERGARIGATGGSDAHWLSTSLVQGPGNPTTWVHAEDRSTTGVLEALRAGRTSVGLVPPALGGAPLLLEADVDGDGTFEATTGDTVPAGTSMRVRSAGTTPGVVDVRGNGADLVVGAPLVPGGEVRFRAPSDRPTGWVRATLSVPEATGERALVCEPLLGGSTTYCRAPLAVLALTSPIYVG
jgi:hypothetical protein